jgi:hypothetical protein
VTNKLFGLHVLFALLVASKFPQVLVAHYQQRRVLRDAAIDAASRCRSRIRRFTAKN